MAKKLINTPTNWDGTLTGDMIAFTENRDSIGYDAETKRWYAPDGSKGYDSNQRGLGVDITTNKYVKPLLKKDERGTYLTEEDERYLRHKSLDDANASYLERLKHAQEKTGLKQNPSEMKKALTINAIYNLGAKTVANELFEDEELMRSLLEGSDKDYSEHVIRYFVKHKKKERPMLVKRFMDKYKQQEEAKRKLIAKKKVDNTTKWNNFFPQFRFPITFINR